MKKQETHLPYSFVHEIDKILEKSTVLINSESSFFQSSPGQIAYFLQFSAAAYKNFLLQRPETNSYSYVRRSLGHMLPPVKISLMGGVKKASRSCDVSTVANITKTE